MSLGRSAMIYFLTVNYYSTELIKSLITSIQAGITSPYELLIVNNSPEDIAVHQLAGERIRVIEAGDNLGFGRGCNLGIGEVWERDHNGLVWLINPDATLDQGADQVVQTCLRNHPNLALLGTQIRNTSGEVWFAAGEFNRWTGYINHRDHPIENIRKESGKESGQALEGDTDICRTDWISGCSLVLNLSEFETCPTFNDSYFLYFEDADLCEQTLRQGHQIAITRQALVTHQVSAIIGKNTAFMYRHYTFGRLLFLWRYATKVGFFLYSAYLMAKIVSLSVKAPDQAQGRWQGVLAFFRYKA